MSTPEDLMHLWQFEHLMETTSNAVESCMKWLRDDIFGLGDVRATGLFNRYRILVMWMMYCCHTRKLILKDSSRLLLRNGARELTPWAVKQLIETAHFVETYRSCFLIKSGDGFDTSLGTAAWSGEEYADYVEGDRLRVIDTKHNLLFFVDLGNCREPCSCHTTYWKKTPCEHVILVLRHLEQYERIWDYFGEVYEVASVRKTCSQWTEKERALFYWLYNMELEWEKEQEIVFRDTRRNNGRNKRRQPSTGEVFSSIKK